MFEESKKKITIKIYDIKSELDKNNYPSHEIVYDKTTKEFDYCNVLVKSENGSIAACFDSENTIDLLKRTLMPTKLGAGSNGFFISLNPDEYEILSYITSQPTYKNIFNTPNTSELLQKSLKKSTETSESSDQAEPLNLTPENSMDHLSCSYRFHLKAYDNYGLITVYTNVESPKVVGNIKLTPSGLSFSKEMIGDKKTKREEYNGTDAAQVLRGLLNIEKSKLNLKK